MLLSSLLPTLLLAATARARYIVPGARWLDTNGSIINAHAGGITIDKDTGRFWWFGEYKIQGQPEGAGFRAYSSDDLATWTDEGMALCMIAFPFRIFRQRLTAPASIANSSIISPKNILQRPKVVYSPQTNQYHVRSPLKIAPWL